MTSFKDYMNVNAFHIHKETGKEITHAEFYNTIVDALGYAAVKQYIPFTLEQLKEAYKTDKSLNNLPLKNWDYAAGFVWRESSLGTSYTRVPNSLTTLYKKIGVNSFSSSDGVCILKACAWRMIEEAS